MRTPKSYLWVLVRISQVYLRSVLQRERILMRNLSILQCGIFQRILTSRIKLPGVACKGIGHLMHVPNLGLVMLTILHL